MADGMKDTSSATSRVVPTSSSFINGGSGGDPFNTSEDSWEIVSMDTEMDHCLDYSFSPLDLEEPAELNYEPVAAASSSCLNSLTSELADLGRDNGFPEVRLGFKEDNNGNTDTPMPDEDHLPPNPLLFPGVIKDVLSYLPASDVESCRLVCHPWNTEACKVLKHKRVVVFTEAAAVKVYVNAMRDTIDFPHAQFEFCIQDFTGLLDESLRDFWQIFGPHIKNLEFRQSHLYWRDFSDVIGQKVPNLEKLGLKHLPRNVPRRNATIERERIQCFSVKQIRLASLPNSQPAAAERLSDLLKAFPNLESVEFLPMKGDAESKISDILVEILQNREVSLSKLRNINVKLELNNDGVEALASKRVPFQSLHLTLVNGVKATSFKDLVISLRRTLSELKITFPDSFSNIQNFSAQNHYMKPEECVQFLSNLKSLEMTSFSKGSINFVHKLPLLESLQFAPTNLAQSIPFGFKSFRGPLAFGFGNQSLDHPLKVLKVIPKLRNVSIAETLTLESIARCFPYLNCLHLPAVDDDGLGVIYRNLPFLSEVELPQVKCSDQGLTGIPQEICKDMLETSTYIVVRAELYRRDLFIGSLQYLSKLSIVGNSISDASVALGLADCKNLKELAVGSPLISDTGVIFITDKFCKQLDVLDVSECTEITEQSKFYAREKLVGKFIEAPQTGNPADAQQGNPVWFARRSLRPHGTAQFNSDRGIVKVKKTSFCTTASSSSKFNQPDTAFFFEEQTELELHDRAFQLHDRAFHPPPLIAQIRRHRIGRIREALRMNGDFMRSLQRMGLQQFRRLFRRELQEGAHGRENPEVRVREHHVEPALFGVARNLILLDPRRMVEPDFVGVDLMFERAELRNGGEGIDEGAGGDNNHLPEAEAPLAVLEDDDGVAVPADDGHGLNRLPENHIGEMLRLGLRVEDIEFWLRNRPLFEQGENGNLDARLLREIQEHDANLIQVVEFPGAGAFLDDDDDDFELEDIRQAVMNAIEDDHPIEG